MKNNKKGLFIVIDGTDGAGKHTQTVMLVEHLRNAGLGTVQTEFPRYDTPSGQEVRAYLQGKYGTDPAKVNVYMASMLYAYDRLCNIDPIRQGLDEGKIVVSDRFTTANMGHQGGKIADSQQRHAYFEWLRDLEYNKFSMPKPDLVILLHVPTDISQPLISDRNREKDIHENDLKHLRDAEKTFAELPTLYPQEMVMLECVTDGILMTKEQIHELIWEIVSPVLNEPE